MKTLIRLGGCPADLSFRRVHMSFCWICHAAAYLSFGSFSLRCFSHDAVDVGGHNIDNTCINDNNSDKSLEEDKDDDFYIPPQKSSLCSISFELICRFQSNFVYALILSRCRFGWLNNIFFHFLQSYGPWLMLKFYFCSISCRPIDGFW